MKVDDIKLLGCPFCNGKARLEQVDGALEYRWSVGCGDEECIGYQSMATFPRQVNAIEAWNRRTNEWVRWQPIFDELIKATTKFPTWPTDPLHAIAVLGEEYGELNKEVLQFVYEPHKTNRDEIRKEAIQCAAMALRFFASLDVYEYKPGEQHKQGESNGR